MAGVFFEDPSFYVENFKNSHGGGVLQDVFDIEAAQEPTARSYWGLLSSHYGLIAAQQQQTASCVGTHVNSSGSSNGNGSGSGHGRQLGALHDFQQDSGCSCSSNECCCELYSGGTDVPKMGSVEMEMKTCMDGSVGPSLAAITASSNKYLSAKMSLAGDRRSRTRAFTRGGARRTSAGTSQERYAPVCRRRFRERQNSATRRWRAPHRHVGSPVGSTASLAATWNSKQMRVG